MKTLITGVAGFIGMSCARALLDRGCCVVGIDNLSDYYDPGLKQARLDMISTYANFTFYHENICDLNTMCKVFAHERPGTVLHLAAQAGVRYSLENPHEYIDTNLTGFLNILEASRRSDISHLVYASSSSVYGSNEARPFTEHDNVDHPLSIYACTKKTNELMAHTYSHLYQIPTTGLRFFTVYGPWGRPDMALFRFAEAMLKGNAIEVFNGGVMTRDFTYIDDVVESVIRVLDKPSSPCSTFDAKKPDPAVSDVPYRIFNVGNGSPTPLMEYIFALEAALGVTAIKNFLPMQAGDVLITAADTGELERWIGYKPNTKIEDGVKNFVDWYLSHYNENRFSNLN